MSGGKQFYTAKRTLGRPCQNCHGSILAGERYFKRMLRGARDASASNRYVEHVECPSPRRPNYRLERMTKRSEPKERLVIVTCRTALHFPLGTTDEQINEYLEGIELGHCGFDDAKSAAGVDDERWPRLSDDD